MAFSQTSAWFRIGFPTDGASPTEPQPPPGPSLGITLNTLGSFPPRHFWPVLDFLGFREIQVLRAGSKPGAVGADMIGTAPLPCGGGMGGPGRRDLTGEGGTQVAIPAGFPQEVFPALSLEQELANFSKRAGW